MFGTAWLVWPPARPIQRTKSHRISRDVDAELGLGSLHSFLHRELVLFALRYCPRHGDLILLPSASYRLALKEEVRLLLL